MTKYETSNPRKMQNHKIDQAHLVFFVWIENNVGKGENAG